MTRRPKKVSVEFHLLGGPIPDTMALRPVWQPAPAVRNDGRGGQGRALIWRVEKNLFAVLNGSRYGVAGWRLSREYDTRGEAQVMAEWLNARGTARGVPVRAMTDEAVALRSRRAASVAVPARPVPARPVAAAPMEPMAPVPGEGEARAEALRAALAARDGIWTFRGLYRGSRRVPAQFVNGFGSAFWRLRDGLDGRMKVPAGATSRIQKELGLRERDEVARGVVRTRREKGGEVNAWVARAGCKWGTDAVLRSGGGGPGSTGHG